MSRYCRSEKLAWSTEERARAELDACRRQAAAGDERRRECAVYQCYWCGWWHLTSRPRQVAA
ncbi:hypothetical protein UA75_30905 (plasmid) [Actinoalloteichus sp. GBA129-24]|nr:hypothetical protein UA75_14425 [Actinoalloteichus sp. GBA129-24]APU24144.1 hypothetical protein UA75_30905 [Actinoalloteichus sp. GBA129-24]